MNARGVWLLSLANKMRTHRKTGSTWSSQPFRRLFEGRGLLLSRLLVASSQIGENVIGSILPRERGRGQVSTNLI